jgi:predicted dienelactone hydrolase
MMLVGVLVLVGMLAGPVAGAGVAAAVSSPAPLPSAMGPYAVTTADFYVGGFQAGGNQDAYLVFPREYAASPAAGFPLVAFAHGCCKNSVNQSASDYNSVFVHLASHGMVVASYNTCLDTCNMITFSGDQLHLINELVERPELHPVLAKVNFSSVAILGHSMGGGSTVFSAAARNIAAADDDYAAAASAVGGSVFIADNVESSSSRSSGHVVSDQVEIRVAVAIDPAPSIAAPKVRIPTFFGCGQNDTIVPCWSVKAMYELSPAAGRLVRRAMGWSSSAEMYRVGVCSRVCARGACVCVYA